MMTSPKKGTIVEAAKDAPRANAPNAENAARSTPCLTTHREHFGRLTKNVAANGERSLTANS
jgi:hypothetical protein